MVSKLTAIGIFTAKDKTQWAGGYDLIHISLQVRAGQRTTMLECEGGPFPDDTVCDMLLAASEYLNPIVAGLGSPKLYRPRGYLLEVSPHEFEGATPWDLPGVDIRAVGAGPYRELVLSPSALTALLRVSHPYYPVFVEYQGYPYEVRWRPLYLHE